MTLSIIRNNLISNKKSKLTERNLNHTATEETIDTGAEVDDFQATLCTPTTTAAKARRDAIRTDQLSIKQNESKNDIIILVIRLRHQRLNNVSENSLCKASQTSNKKKFRQRVLDAERVNLQRNISIDDKRDIL